MLVNPQATGTPCATATFDSDASKCATSTKVGSITVAYRVAGKNYSASGSVYSITPDANSVINFGFVVSANTYFQKFLFKSGKAVGLTTVRPDYGLSILVPNIPRTIKSVFGTSTSMTISNISITLNPRVGTSATSPYFTFAPTRCDAATSKVSFTSYLGVTASKTSSYTPTGCEKINSTPSFTLSNSNTNAGQATGISATVNVQTSDADIQQSHVKDVIVNLSPGTTINLGPLNALALCSDAQVATDTCPAASKMGTATVNVPFLPAPMTGGIYLTSRDGVQFVYIVHGARGTIATLRGSTQPAANGLETTLQTLPQVPWSSATLNFTTLVINNPVNKCPNATAWATVNGYSGAQSMYGTFYNQTNCPPDTTITSQPISPTYNTTPSFSFASNPAGATSYQCKIDNATFAACASPYTAPALYDGIHTFYVRALASTGVADQTPASYQFTVDTVKPAIAISSPAEGATITTSSVTLNFTTEPGSTNYCRLDTGALPACTGQSSISYANLADGPHKFRVISLDQAGNIAWVDRNFTVATPKVPIVSLSSPVEGGTGPTSYITPIFTVTSPSGAAITSVKCTLQTWYPEFEYTPTEFEGPCTSGQVIDMMADDQPARLQVDATDANGNVGTVSVVFNSGIKPPYSPDVNEADLISNLSINERTPTFRLEENGDAWPNKQYDCSLVKAGQPANWIQCGVQGNLPAYQVTTALANGDYSFSLRTRSGTVTGPSSRMDFTVGDWNSKYTATTTTTQAGAHPDLDVDITPTGAGQMRSVDMSLPKGLIGSTNSFARCSDLIKAICPAETKVGSVDVDYTVYGGISLKRAPGDVYFTGPQVAGDVAGLVIRVFGPVKPYADVIIPLRIQLTNNSQTMRVFSDTIPTNVGNIYDPTLFIRYWLKDFKMHINGSAGSPFPLLTNPSSCAAGQFSNVTGGIAGAKTAAQTIAYTATGCSALPFNPTISQTFSSTTAGAEAGVTAEVNLPTGNSSFKTLKVNEPAAFGPNFPAFGAVADQCPASAAPTGSSVFDPTNCPAAAKVGTMTIDTPLLTAPLNGTVYLINKSPLPWLGVKLDDVGVSVRLTGVTTLPQVDPSCDPSTSETGTCPSQIAITFANIPDLPVSRIRMTIDGPNRTGTGGSSLSGKILTVATASDPACVPTINAATLFTPSSGTPNVSATQAINFSGCSAH
jgi:hypothetical protein